jgi:hypothetical protein
MYIYCTKIFSALKEGTKMKTCENKMLRRNEPKRGTGTMDLRKLHEKL